MYMYFCQVALHDANEVPLLTELSYGVSPGTETNMIIQRTETRRVPPPADSGQSDCFDTSTRKNPLHYFSNYTYAACYQECKISFVISQCGCRDLLQEPLNRTESCNIERMLYCSSPAIEEFQTNPEYLQACDCKSVCNEVQYSASISTSRFPSQRYVEDMRAAGYNGTYEYLVQNVASVNIFFGQMSYQLLTEDIAYTPYDLIANLGGTFGVCLGASLMTLVEFVEFGLLSLYNRLFRGASKPNRIQVVSYEA
ncbi:acid-sensing ion channel 1-like [Watersipora subatra]|uniref:acid-sensing ion channel 1-like n=1 Tax=Watersipora subatra TaxID=2589382 RepID=UPI00355B4585